MKTMTRAPRFRELGSAGIVRALLPPRDPMATWRDHRTETMTDRVHARAAVEHAARSPAAPSRRRATWRHARES